MMSQCFYRVVWVLLVGLALAVRVDAQTEALPVNIAPLASGLWAESENSAPYAIGYVVDGVIPDPGSCDDAHRAWAVDGATHNNECRVRFEWEKPQTVGEVVYYGRTAWLAEECWKDYAVYLDDADEPVASGQFQRGHGPQRVTLPQPVQCSSLTLHFTSSWGGINTGASEIEIYPSPVPEGMLPEFIELPPGRTALFLSKDSPLDKELQALPESRALEADLTEGRLGFNALVLVHRKRLMPSHVYTYHNEGFDPGGGLYVYTPQGGETGRLELLVASPEGQILDVDVSYDGQTILFSWRRGEGEVYQLYTIRTDGSGFTQLTDNPWHTFNACWLPDGDIAFLAAPESAYAYCWTSPVGILHRMKPDGTGVVRLSANYLNDFTPGIMNDGQIVYGRWEYVDRPAIPIQGLWTINPDGTGLEQFYGNRVLSPATFIEPRAIPGSPDVLCILTAHNGPCRGAVGIIDPRQGDNVQDSIRNLTPEVDIGKVDEGSGNHIVGPYENPYPLDGELFLVSRDGTVLLRDYDNTRQVVVKRPDGGMGYYSPQPVRAEAVPPVRASALPPDPEPMATLFLQDVYQGLEPHVKRGEIKRIAVVQEIEKSQLADLNQRSFGFQFPTVSAGATYAPKRVLGTATVEADGSACFRVPAGLPIYFMALDAEGRALQRMRTFTHLMPGETQGCIGCHEPRSHTTPMIGTPLAFGRPPEDLATPEWGDQGFSYAHIVQPVLDRHCAECHNPETPEGGLDLTGDRTDFFNVSYEYLARLGTVGMDPDMGGIPRAEDVFTYNPYTRWIYTYNGAEPNILMIEPRQWGSPASRLSDLLISGHPDDDGNPRVALSETERQRIHTWIDLNVPYYGTSKFNYPERMGCRRQYPEQLDTVLQEVGARRCAECHGIDDAGLVDIPRDFFVRVTGAENNAFLRAPLAAAAGGSEACAEVVFASTEDPDYQAILATFNDVLEELERRPRMDMVEDPAAAGLLPACADTPLAAPAAARPPAFAASDYSRGRVCIVSEEGEIVWEHPAPSAQDIWLLPSGNRVFSHFHGVKEVRPDGSLVWEFTCEEPNEVQSCQALPDGRTLIGELGACRLVEVDGTGAIVKEIPVPVDTTDLHMQFRQVRKTPAGTYLVACTGDGVVRELDDHGQVLRTIEAGPLVYGAVPLPDGNVLIGCGEGHRIIEVDPEGNVVWEVNENDIPGNPLRFVAGLQRLSNGNTVVCNWDGFGFVGQQPQVFEITREKEVVWEIHDNERFGSITHINIADADVYALMR